MRFWKRAVGWPSHPPVRKDQTMTSRTFLHDAVTYGAIAGILLSSFAPPLAAQAPGELPPVPAAAPGEPPSLDELLAPPGGAVVPGDGAEGIADDMEIPGTIPLTEDGVRAATAADPV